MPPPVESRVSGDILIPLRYNQDPDLAISHARQLSELFSVGVTFTGDLKGKTIPEGLKFTQLPDEKDLVGFLKKNKENYSLVIIHSGVLDNGDKKKHEELIGVIRDSPVPVLSICAKPVHDRLQTLLLPFDLTRESTLKLSKAIDFSASDKNIIIQVISVLFSVDDFVINKLTRQIEEVRYSLEQKGVECSAELIKTEDTETHGEVVSEIADRNDVDLVMIMAQLESEDPESGLHRDVLDIVRRCPAPVLTINPR